MMRVKEIIEKDWIGEGETKWYYFGGQSYLTMKELQETEIQKRYNGMQMRILDILIKKKIKILDESSPYGNGYVIKTKKGYNIMLNSCEGHSTWYCDFDKDYEILFHLLENGNKSTIEKVKGLIKALDNLKINL